ncbi:MBL fold metallo-hydrolase [Butyrivibrio sp. YAB3001]|uniref:MBL fold metallo-hydrolase n=1 Tax=Butyrivibrio sp. YAB3001 TaxID=1520812 RepID=UPI0008F62C8C|nr:MBL fold metallo-hydrolase [Butyrivibrio sp. YAB3001]SFB68207.1 L-ascorbate metabolism protein UlaG, beta-lactamase superfamily [Butyrivibrio sp. YAB3001]
MNKYTEEIISTNTPYGSAALWWLGQMGLIVKMGATTVCIDYYATPGYDRQIQPPIPTDEVIGIDAFLGTHDHLDHIDHEAWKIWVKNCPEAKFVFPKPFKDAIIEDGVNPKNALGINEGESIHIGDVTIHAIAASHEFLDKDETTGLFPYLQYIVEGNGVRIHHAGDTVRYEGMLPKLRGFGHIDVELLPINGRDADRYRRCCIGNMTYQEAADLAGDVQPGLVIPGHYDMFKDNSEDPIKFKEYIDVKYQEKLKCIIPRIMDTIIVCSEQ